ncbi:MAG: hypothetical protein AAF547_00945 [Actinomycetota bacterium]
MTAACAAAFSNHPDPAVAVGETVGSVLDRIDPHPSVVLVLAAGPSAAALVPIADAVGGLLAPEVLIASAAPAVIGGLEHRAAPSGFVVVGINVDGPVEPVRIGTGEPLPAAGCGGPLLLFGDASVGFGPRPVAVGVGAVASGQTRLVHDGLVATDGTVGVGFPPGAAERFEFLLPAPADIPDPFASPEGVDIAAELAPELSGDTIPVARPFDPGAGAGLLLFGTPSTLVAAADRFDLELAVMRFPGALAGAAGRVIHPAPAPGVSADHRLVGLVIGPDDG